MVVGTGKTASYLAPVPNVVVLVAKLVVALAGRLAAEVVGRAVVAGVVLVAPVGFDAVALVAWASSDVVVESV